MQTANAPATPTPTAGGLLAAGLLSARWYAAAGLTFFLGWGSALLYIIGGKRLGLLAPAEKPNYLLVGLFLVVSLLIFIALERRFLLHRLAGYLPLPDSSPTVAGLCLWAGGVPYLTVRHNLLSATKPAETPKPGPHHPGRETLETFAFVIVLVLLLKSFVIEAFVIPTGSMAESLFGYNQVVACEECGYEFPLNSTCEVEPTNGPMRPVEGYCCPNCRFKSLFVRSNDAVGSSDPSVLKPRSPRLPNKSGDRLLVHKAMPELRPYRAGDIVVFKFPPEPQKQYSSQNYIKRLWGLGGETLAIWKGDLYVCKSLPAPANLPESAFGNPSFYWPTDDAAKELFEKSRKAGFPPDAGGFELLRKSDDVALDMKRVVWDNDFQSNYLARKSAPARWKPQTDDWQANDAEKGFRHSGASLGWVRYRHVPVQDWSALAGEKPSYPELKPIDNFLGYNAETGPGGRFLQDGTEDYRWWVGDLLLECRAEFVSANAEITLELSKGVNRFQATLGNGKLKLVRTGKNGIEHEFPAPISGPGTHDIRFANVDARLRVWIDGRALDLGDKANYGPAEPELYDPYDSKHEGWTTANDVREPASIAAVGDVAISRIKLYRDTYFISGSYSGTSDASELQRSYYVRPGHVLCFGDNSAASSDGRSWGAVPENLLLGKAVFVFFPLDRIGVLK
jgi:signal peptidase I